MVKKNILQVIHTLKIGGAEKVVKEIATNLEPSRFNCFVSCLDQGGVFKELIDTRGIPVEILNVQRSSIKNFPLFLIDVIRILVGLNKIVKKNNIHVIHSHLDNANYLSIIIGIIRKIPVFPTIHSTSEFTIERKKIDPRYWLRKVFNRIAYRFCTKIIAVSEEVKESVLKEININPKKIIVINNAVDIDKFSQEKNIDYLYNTLGIKNGDLVVSSIGRLERVKGHIFLLKAVADILKIYPDTKFFLVGSGSQQEKLQDFVVNNSLEQNVHFLGNRSDIPELLSLTDVFVMPSIAEGLSMAMLEAMASGRAIVSANTNGIRKLIAHGVTGLLFPKGDVGQLRDEIISLLSDKNLRVKLGQNARKHVSQYYNLKVFIKNVQNLYSLQI
jgi:glycosyltransferase involved in cell wall biosynthesis